MLSSGSSLTHFSYCVPKCNFWTMSQSYYSDIYWCADLKTALEINNNIFLVIIFGNKMPQRQRDPFCYDSEKLSFISYMNFWQFQEISALLDNLTCCAQQEIVRLACSHIAGKFLYGSSMHEAGHRLALNILNYYLLPSQSTTSYGLYTSKLRAKG